MPTIRVATFNCENLFARFKFEAGIDPATASANGFTVNETKFDLLNEGEKALTARAKEVAPRAAKATPRTARKVPSSIRS